MALFESFPVHNGKPVFIAAHLRRLKSACDRCGFHLDLNAFGHIPDLLAQVQFDAFVRVYVTAAMAAPLEPPPIAGYLSGPNRGRTFRRQWSKTATGSPFIPCRISRSLPALRRRTTGPTCTPGNWPLSVRTMRRFFLISEVSSSQAAWLMCLLLPEKNANPRAGLRCAGRGDAKLGDGVVRCGRMFPGQADVRASRRDFPHQQWHRDYPRSHA